MNIDKDWIDFRGQIKMRKSASTASDQDNAHLYSMYGIMLMNETQIYDDLYIKTYKDFVPKCLVSPGIYNRSIMDQGDVPSDVVSHDEYNGLAAFSVYYNVQIAKDIVDYGKKYGWCYNNVFPNKKANAITAFFKDGEDRAILTYKRQPRDIFIYKVAAGLKPSVFELLYFCLSILTKALKDPLDYAKGSSQCIGLLQLAICARAGYKSRILALTFKFFCNKMMDRFGDKFAHELFAMHFYSKEHPWAQLALNFDAYKLVTELK